MMPVDMHPIPGEGEEPRDHVRGEQVTGGPELPKLGWFMRLGLL